MILCEKQLSVEMNAIPSTPKTDLMRHIDAGLLMIRVRCHCCRSPPDLLEPSERCTRTQRHHLSQVVVCYRSKCPLPRWYMLCTSRKPVLNTLCVSDILGAHRCYRGGVPLGGQNWSFRNWPDDRATGCEIGTDISDRLSSTCYRIITYK